MPYQSGIPLAEEYIPETVAIIEMLCLRLTVLTTFPHHDFLNHNNQFINNLIYGSIIYEILVFNFLK